MEYHCMLFSGNVSFRYYLFSISNLLAAFGGGLILGKGAGIIHYPYLQGGSILAFFIGTILGLVFLQFIPKKSSNFISQFFSISCGITSLILFYIYQNHSLNGNINGISALVFFLLLSVRFGFWFYSRVMRASIATSHQQSIAWVEFGYYIGIVLGLVIWKLFDIPIGLGTALIIDAIFQFMAGILDLINVRIGNSSLEKSKEETPLITDHSFVQYSHEWCWKLSRTVVLLTIGVQVVIFNTAHFIADSFGSYILATFYLGVAAGAYTCNKFKIYMTWIGENNLATIATNTGKKIQFNVLFLTFMLALAVSIVLPTINLNHSITSSVFINGFVVCVFVFISAFIYEVISVSLLDRIGYEEIKLDRSGMIMRTYGLMGLGAAIGFWILGIMGEHLISSIATLFICLSLATMTVLKRNSILLDLNPEVYPQ